MQSLMNLIVTSKGDWIKVEFREEMEIGKRKVKRNAESIRNIQSGMNTYTMTFEPRVIFECNIVGVWGF